MDQTVVIRGSARMVLLVAEVAEVPTVTLMDEVPRQQQVAEVV
jgi:hypothetical protein